MELHSTVIFPVLKKPGGLHCHILSIWFGSVEGLDRSTPRATWYMILLGGWTIHHKMWKLLVALGTMQHTLERRTYFKSPSPTQYLSWIAIGQLHTSPLYIYIIHIWCPNMLNYAVGSIYLGKRDHEFASGFLRSHHWRSLEFLFSRNVESFTSLHVGSFWMIPGENIILREASAADCLPRLDNRL